MSSRIADINMNSSPIVRDVDMGIVYPIKSNVMVECNRERKDFWKL